MQKEFQRDVNALHYARWIQSYRKSHTAKQTMYEVSQGKTNYPRHDFASYISLQGAFEIRGIHTNSKNPKEIIFYFGMHLWIRADDLCRDPVGQALLMAFFIATKKELQGWIKRTWEQDILTKPTTLLWTSTAFCTHEGISPDLMVTVTCKQPVPIGKENLEFNTKLSCLHKKPAGRVLMCCPSVKDAPRFRAERCHFGSSSDWRKRVTTATRRFRLLARPWK